LLANAGAAQRQKPKTAAEKRRRDRFMATQPKCILPAETNPCAAFLWGGFRSCRRGRFPLPPPLGLTGRSAAPEIATNLRTLLVDGADITHFAARPAGLNAQRRTVPVLHAHVG